MHNPPEASAPWCLVSTCLESLGSSHYSVSTCTTVWITQSLSLSLSLSLSQFDGVSSADTQ